MAQTHESGRLQRFPPPRGAFQPQRASKPDDASTAQSRTPSPQEYESRWRARGSPKISRGRFSGTQRQSGRLDEPRRLPRSRSRARSSGHADCVVDKKAREERLRAWGAGVDAEGLLQDLPKNCHVGTGTRAPRRKGPLRQDLGNPCFLRRRVLGCDAKDFRHWRAIVRTARS